MKDNVLKKIIVKHIDSLISLEKRKIFIITGLINGGLLIDEKKLSINDSLFNAGSLQSVDILLSSKELQSYQYPAIFDIVKAASIYEAVDGTSSERIFTALIMSRINFMGTDGIRGKVSLDIEKDFISDFLIKGHLTPQLIESLCCSYCRLLHSTGNIKEGDTIVIGEDGRDFAFSGKLKKAMMIGFSMLNFKVLDLGVVPTAMVPYKILKNELRAGAMLTASHNPSNQNGIKFFLDGKKLLPEGETGDFAISAFLYEQYLYPAFPIKKETSIILKNTENFSQFICTALSEEIFKSLKNINLILDTANGAAAEIADKVFDYYHHSYTSVNEKPNGFNINKNCGVSELEAHDLYLSKDFDTSPPVIKELFNKGHKSPEGSVFAIALDGDGDRGFLLYYEKKSGRVHLLGGDKCGYILAKYFIKNLNINPSDYFFISTIESDLMVSEAVSKELGLKIKTVDIGDKWICNFSEGPICVGVENSGHVIFPIQIKTLEGKEKILLSGIGLLTGLMTLHAIKSMNLSNEEIINPYKQGVSKTFYSYFIDKTMFYRNSNVWQMDHEAVSSAVTEYIRSGELPEKTKVRSDDKDDINVLYLTIINRKYVIGCIFVRNSGTEDKIAVYVKGRKDFEKTLFMIGKKLNDQHIALMKNISKVEYAIEKEIIAVLIKDEVVSIEDLKKAIQKKIATAISDNDLHGVIYGLKKEERIYQEDGMIRIAEQGKDFMQ